MIIVNIVLSNDICSLRVQSRWITGDMGRTQKGCLLKNDNGFQKHHGGFLNIPNVEKLCR